MQRGLIDKVKKTYKNIKQDVKGAEIFGVEFIEKNIDIRSKEVFVDYKIREKKTGISSQIQNLDFIKEYSTYDLHVEKTSNNIYGIEEKISSNIYNMLLEEEIEVDVKKIIDYEKFTCTVLGKELEEFRTTVLFELVEKTKKAKIEGFVEKGFKVKVTNGKEKMYLLPRRYRGRSFLGKKEMIEIGARVKEAKPDFDFREYKFLAIFESLPVYQMKKFRYLEEEKELLFYFDKRKKEGLGPMDLVVWSRKNSPLIEKIFI